MTLIPKYKKCPKCKQYYSWNPDVGKMWCPDCGLMGEVGPGRLLMKKIEEMLEKKKKY